MSKNLVLITLSFLLLACGFKASKTNMSINGYLALKTYTNDELLRLLGHQSPESVRDFFLLLPDSLIFEKTGEERKQILGDGHDHYKVFEETERYINLTGPFEGEWEIYHSPHIPGWALNYRGCGPACETLQAHTYIFNNNTLYQSERFGFISKISIDDLVDKTDLNASQRDALVKTWLSLGKAVLYDLPRQNDSLSVYLDPLFYLDDGIPYTVFKKLKIPL